MEPQPGGGNKMSTLYCESVADIRLVSLSGPLNRNRAGDAIRLFRDLSEQGVQRIVVNLEDVPFVDSRGLAALIAGYRIFGGDAQNFRLSGIQDQPRLVFELTGFDHIFPILDSVDKVMAAGQDQARTSWSSSLFLPQLAALDWAM